MPRSSTHLQQQPIIIQACHLLLNISNDCSVGVPTNSTNVAGESSGCDHDGYTDKTGQLITRLRHVPVVHETCDRYANHQETRHGLCHSCPWVDFRELTRPSPTARRTYGPMTQPNLQAYRLPKRTPTHQTTIGLP